MLKSNINGFACLSKLSWLWSFCAYREQCPLVRTAWFCSLCCQTQSTKSPSLLFTPRETDRQPPRRDGRVSHIDAEFAWLLFLSLSFLHSLLFLSRLQYRVLSLTCDQDLRAELEFHLTPTYLLSNTSIQIRPGNSDTRRKTDFFDSVNDGYTRWWYKIN